MSKWHKFEVRHHDLTSSDLELRDMFRTTYRWLKANMSGKWKIVCLKPGGIRRTGIRPFLQFSPLPGDSVLVSIKKSRDATLFKMFFGEHYRDPKTYTDYAPVLISLVRRAMPQILASQICGVQPMTGPVAPVFSLRPRYVDQSTGKGNSIFNGRGSPSKRRAFRKRMRNRGVFFTSVQSGKPMATPPARSTIDRIMKNVRKTNRNTAKASVMSQLLKNTMREFERGR